LGRAVIFAEWENGMSVPVPPHEIVVLEPTTAILEAA
jgi:hypothetical protein